MPTNKELEKMQNEDRDRLGNVEDSLGEILKILKSSDAKDNPVSITKGLDAAELQETSMEPVMFAEIPELELKQTGPDVDYEFHRAQQKEAIEAFMNEELAVRIEESSEENAQPQFDIGVNGITRLFVLGEVYTNVKRYHVEGLARAKPVRFRNNPYTRNDGTNDVMYLRSSGLRFNFTVLRDPNPRGSDWLKQVLAED